MQKTKKSERELVLQNKKRHINQHMNAASSSPEGPWGLNEARNKRQKTKQIFSGFISNISFAERIKNLTAHILEVVEKEKTKTIRPYTLLYFLDPKISMIWKVNN